MARSRPGTQAPGRLKEPAVGQLGLFGSPEPWHPTAGCRCWPVDQRGCHHCRACDTCLDCGRCAGRGCQCACETS